MDNKLSELSKPVAWAFKDASDVEHASIIKKANLYGRHDFQPLYSQEYVSALLADNEAKDRRIAELEAKTAMTMGVGDGGGSLFVHGDYDSIKAAQHIVFENESLRANLATPVRLPAYRNSPDMHTKQYYEAIGFNQALDACGNDIRAAGFTVEGDE
ncbi:hypothetical protein I5N01_05490 [Serratia marcescens]|nr:hypothetical protein [Serratia marcescens]